MSNDLIVLEEIKAIDIFNSDKKDADKLIEKIKEVALSEIPDLTTAKGRKAIASNAAKVSKCKTYLEDAGKSLVADEKTRLKKIDGVRKKVKEALEDLRDEVRKPLTEWEDKEKERVAKNQAILTFLIDSVGVADNWMNKTIEELNELLEEVNEIKITKRLQEFEEEIKSAQKNAASIITDSLEKKNQYDEDQKELEKLREAQKIQERKDFEHNEKLESSERERKAVIQANSDKKAAEQRAIETEKQAAIDAKEAEKQKKIEVEAAAQAEREKIEAEKQEEIEAEKLREADKSHRGKINRNIVLELLKCNIDEAQAKKVVTAIAKGKVPNVKISY